MNCMFRSSTFESCTTQYGTLDKRMGFKTSVRLLSTRCEPLDAWGNEAVWYNGSVVGYTTSGGYGHTVHKSIALAYVPPKLAVEGHQVDVELVGHKYKATVHLEPFMETQLMRKLKQAET
ncbi:hypothetical protein B5M09_007099 [Aphanomyces astaci]|uniref:Aminomethyltransferase C-terminal domain-containing protein n=1 Tax=Aphanomyces astaci TaxID=112090 RepID=A0A3R7XYY9_APHAT|nr:hypothetical protein B5M09_007099 [Aphanomyces astaci]